VELSFPIGALSCGNVWLTQKVQSARVVWLNVAHWEAWPLLHWRDAEDDFRVREHVSQWWVRLFRHRGLHGCRCYVRTKVHWLSIVVLYSDTAAICRYCFLSHIPIDGHHMSVHTDRSACLYKRSLLYTDSSDRRPSTNSVALSPQANYTDWRPPLVDEI
jgi:hypothetical protein